MEDLSDSEADPNRSLGVCVSDSKLMREKRSSVELGVNADHVSKRVKMCDLESVVRSKVFDTHYPQSSKTIHANNQFHFDEEEMYQVTKEPVAMNSDDVVQAEKTAALLVNRSSKPLDLNTKVSYTNNLVPGDTICTDDSSKMVLPRKVERKKEVGGVNSRSFQLDLNVEDVSSSVNHDPFYPYKNHDHLKSRDISECGSSAGPLKEKDPMKVWKEMKQNGFQSSSHGGILMPKQCGRKSKNDVMKKKMEIAKKEQVDRFMKLAAPSGLLNELNPGIITNVRNMKQVHSIIEGLVKSERREKGRVGSKPASQPKSGSKEISDGKDQENMNDSRVRPSFSQEDGSHNTLSGSRQICGYIPINKPSVSLEERSGDADSSMVDRRIKGRASCDLDSTPGNEDDIHIPAMKLSSSTAKGLENASCVSTEENLSSVFSLSVKAATVASHWLELLHQDIKGRLAALRRSKKRVCAVIHTELPFLLSKEFSSNQENDPFITLSSAAGCSKAIADMHQAKWSTLFNQMDTALSEEEKQMECWLNQVREMQLHCNKGLQHNHLNTSPWLGPMGMSENSSRSKNVDKSERELAVRAAAASIYSTCNFLLPMENVPCF